jgi:hypothetical protein
VDGPGEEQWREAAAPDERGQIADDHDAIADEGDSVSYALDTLSDSARRVEDILLAAEIRDRQADARDSEAHRRDMAANLDAFIHRVDDESAYQARTLAAKDRARARADRVASKLDRHLLTGLSPNADERAAAASEARDDPEDGTDGDTREGP